MRISLSEFLEAMSRAREEERARASTILSDRDRDLIRKIEKFREEIKATWEETLEKRGQVLSFLDGLDPRPSGPPGTTAEYAERLKKIYPTMFKGGPT